MKSVVGQLDRDSLLVLYQAGELSAEDRRRVERMLDADEAMRAELEGLRAAEGMLEDGLALADQRQRLPVERRVLERRVGRMIREWEAVRPEAPQTVVQKVVGLKYPWWAYPTVAAAAVTLAFLVWWGNTPLRPYNSPLAQNAPVQQEQTDDQSPAEFSETAQLAEDLESSFFHPSHEGLREAEGELVALSQARETLDELEDIQQQDLN